MEEHVIEQVGISQQLSSPKTIIIIISLLHFLGLLIYVVDFYFLQWYITYYNEGLVPDQQMFEIRGKSVLDGNLPYENLESYESLAPPLSMYVLSIPILVSWIVPVPLAILYRIYFSLFNIATSWLLIKIGELFILNNRKYLATILYGMGPFMVMQGAYAGSDECMGAFIMMLVVYLIATDKIKLAVLLIGIGASVKYYPILLIPFLLATRSTLIDQVKHGLISILSVLTFFLPYYFINPNNFMLQFDNRVSKVPWDSPGNSGIIILVERLGIINLRNYELQYRIVWISLLVLISAIQILKKLNNIEDAVIVPSIFFLIYPKFFFSYFAIILPFFCIAFVHRKSPLQLWFILHFGLILGGFVNDRVIGYSSVYRQDEGNVPVELTIGIVLFYLIWLLNWLLIFIRRDLLWVGKYPKFPHISIFKPSYAK